MMIVLLASILLAGVGGDRIYKPLIPGAATGTALRKIQETINSTMSDFFRHDEKTDKWYYPADLAPMLPMVDQQLCQLERSYLLSQDCKNDFKSMDDQKYRESEYSTCTNATCEAWRYMEDNSWPDMVSLTSATKDSQFFAKLKELYVDPFMQWNCACARPLMSTWTGCAPSMGGAQIWSLLPMLPPGVIDPTYITMIKTMVIGFPWEAVQDVVLRGVDHMCKDVDDEKCYEQLYNSAQEIFKIFVKTNGTTELAQTLKERGKNPLEHCLALTGAETMVDFTTTLDFMKQKFCVAECKDYYQDALMGCCLASIVNDNDLENDMRILAEEAREFFSGMNFNFADKYYEYMGYAEETLETMRNPTCQNNGVIYTMEGCEGPGSMTQNACPGMKGQKLKKCMNKHAGGSDGGSSDDGPCAGKNGKKLKKCMQKQAGGSDGGPSDDGPCAGKKGNKRKKCLKKHAGGSDGGPSDDGPCAGKKGKKLKICKRKQDGGNDGGSEGNVEEA